MLVQHMVQRLRNLGSNGSGQLTQSKFSYLTNTFHKDAALESWWGEGTVNNENYRYGIPMLQFNY